MRWGVSASCCRWIKEGADLASVLPLPCDVQARSRPQQRVALETTLMAGLEPGRGSFLKLIWDESFGTLHIKSGGYFDQADTRSRGWARQQPARGWDDAFPCQPSSPTRSGFSSSSPSWFMLSQAVAACDQVRCGAASIEASRRHSDAASKTRSLSRNCPTSAEMAGKPPAAAAATPGVLARNVRVMA